jgi:lipoprotein-releasing system permease protein
VVGIFESGFYEYDSTIAYLSLKDAQDFTQFGTRVTGLEIRVHDIYKADSIAKEIERALGPLFGEALDGYEQEPFLALKLESGSCSSSSV